MEDAPPLPTSHVIAHCGPVFTWTPDASTANVLCRVCNVMVSADDATAHLEGARHRAFAAKHAAKVVGGGGGAEAADDSRGAEDVEFLTHLIAVHGPFIKRDEVTKSLTCAVCEKTSLWATPQDVEKHLSIRRHVIAAHESAGRAVDPSLLARAMYMRRLGEGHVLHDGESTLWLLHTSATATGAPPPYGLGPAVRCLCCDVDVPVKDALAHLRSEAHQQAASTSVLKRSGEDNRIPTARQEKICELFPASLCPTVLPKWVLCLHCGQQLLEKQPVVRAHMAMHTASSAKSK